MNMSELDKEFYALQDRLEVLRKTGEDKIKGGDYDATLQRMLEVSKARTAHLRVWTPKSGYQTL